MLKEMERPAQNGFVFGHTRSFTAAYIGGKVHLPDFLLSERRKTGISTYTADAYSGKVYLQDFLPSKLRKTFKWIPIMFCLLLNLGWVTGPGFGPHNEGWACIINV